MFAIAERLHITVTAVERMSAREVQGWVDYWRAPAAAADDDALDMASLSPETLRSMFPGR